ncbi:MAG: tandem-95 repeat protein [Bacteroidales bacterium]|nr:tandem-95 repeat protein [Bacteroidales bacterium]
MESIFRKQLYRKNHITGKAVSSTFLLFIVSLLLTSVQLSAQHGWSVNPNDYSMDGEISGIVYLDGVLMTEGALGAFANDSCRGFDDFPEDDGPSGLPVFQIRVYSNTDGEQLSFRFYNLGDGLEYDVVETLEFSQNMILGDARDPLVFNAVTNDPPVVSSPVVSRTYNEYFEFDDIDLSAVFSDPDLNTLTYTAVSDDPGVVSVSVAGDVLTITEAGLGNATVTVTADDGLATVQELFTVTVNNVNDAPEVANALPDMTRDEGFVTAPVDLSATFTDKDNDVLSYSASSGNPGSVTVSVVGTTLTITEVYPGSAVIMVTAQDASESVSTSFTFTTNNINDAPVVADAIDNLVLNENFGTHTIDLSTVFFDEDQDVLTYVPVSSNTGVVTVGVSGNTLTITEVGLGTSTITVTASDASTSVSDIFTVAVSNVNDPPIVLSPVGPKEYPEGFNTTPINLSGVFSDPDGDPLTYSATSSDTDVVTVSVASAVLTITEAGTLGQSTVEVTASDGNGGSVNTSFVVTIYNVNDAPEVVAAIPDQQADEYFGSRTIVLDPVFTDKDGDGLTYTASSNNTTIVTVAVNGADLVITEQGLGTATITVNASDGLESVSTAFSFTVNNVNDAPAVANPLADLQLDEYFGSRTRNLAGVFTDKDGDALTLTARSGNTNVVTVSMSGSILYITERGLGSATITVTATDNGDGPLSTDHSFLINVNNVNDPPVVADPLDDIVTDENFVTLPVALAGVFTDKDSDPLSYTALSSNAGVVTTSVSGSTLTIHEEGLGTATITVTASDGSLSVSDQFSITINNVNDAPKVVAPILDRNFNEGFVSASISVSPVFNDEDGDVLTYTVESSNTAVVSVTMNGTTLNITERGNGTATLTVTASDGLLSVSDAFIVRVVNLNDAPVVINPVADQEENEYFGSIAIDISRVFFDEDGDLLTITAGSSDASVVTTGISGNILTITERGLGTATITLTADDDLLTVQDEFLVTVNNVNDAPVVQNSIADLPLDEHFGVTTLDLSNVFSDKDGDPLTLSVDNSAVSVVTVALSGTTLTITEAGLGSATITVNATDGALGVSDQFVIIVNNVNDAPVVVQPVQGQVYNERFGSATISVASVFSDPDGNALTLSAVSNNPGIVTVVLSGTTLTISEAGLGDATVSVTASDGFLSQVHTFNVTVNNVNDPPVLSSPIADQHYVEYFNQSLLSISNLFSDPDGDVLSYTVGSSDESVATVSVSGTTVTINEEGLGSTTVEIRATDGEFFVDYAFDVTISNVNDAPEVVNAIADQVLDEYFGSTSLGLSTVFDDKDGDALTLSALSSNPSVVTVAVSGNNLVITEAGLGSAQVTVTASDGSLSADEQFTVTVNNVNDAPLVSNPIADLVLNEHFNSTSLNLAGVFTDPDGDAILLSVRSSNPGIVTVSLSGTLLIIREAGLGTATVTVTGSDGSLATEELFLVTVNNVNDAPEVVAPISSASRSEGFGFQNIDLAPVFSDPDGDAMTYTAFSSNNTVVTVSISGTTLTISEVGLGASTITVTASDGEFSTEDQFAFTIDNVNDSPEVLVPLGNRSYDEGFLSTSVNLTNFFSDPDGDVLSFSAVSSNTGVVTVSVSGSTLTITEVGLGSSDVTVTASDGSLTNSDVFTASVGNVNDPPEIQVPAPDQSYNEYFGTETVDLSAVFSDPDGDALTISAISSNTNVVTVSVSGTTLTITERGLGTSTINLTATDGELSAVDQFNVVVNNVNDNPVVQNPLPDREYDEGFASSGISLAATFTDKDGDVLSLSAVSSNTGVVTVSITGTILTIRERGLGTAAITVTASDGSLHVTDNFDVVVNNVNDAPVVVNPIPDRQLDEHFGSVAIPLGSVFSDPDVIDQLTFSAVSGNTSVVGVSVSGTTLTLLEAGLGSTIVTVTATDDGDGNLSTDDVFSVTVNNVNDAPEVAVEIADQVFDEYFGSYELDLSGTFTDPDADPLVLTATSSHPGIVGVEVDGSTVTILETGLGTATITVTASDGSLSVDEQFIVLVNNVNDAPVVANPIADQVYNEYFNVSTLSISNLFSDKDGDVLTYTVTSSDPAVVTVEVTSTIVAIREVGLGTAVVTITASDGEYQVSDVINVTVNNVNDRPRVANPLSDRQYNEYFATDTLDISGVFADKDRDVLILSAVSSDPSIVSVAVSGTELIITEQGLGVVEVTVTASDGSLEISDRLNITVNNVNDPPVVVSPIQDQDYNEYFHISKLSLTNVFSDKDGDVLTLSAVSSNPAVVTASVDGFILTITEQGLGLSTITLTASDGRLTEDASFVVRVNNVNDAPVVANPLADLSGDEYEGPFTVDLSAVFTDKDGDPLTLTGSSSDTTVLRVSVTGTTLSISEVAPGIAEITVTATDPGALFAQDRFVFTLNNVNDAPEVANTVGFLSLKEYFETEDIDISDVFFDKDGDPLTYKAVSSNTSVLTVSMEGDMLILKEAGLGTTTITLTASDGSLSGEDIFEVSVDNVNDNPLVRRLIPDQEQYEYFEMLVVDLHGVFSDPDVGDILTLSVFSSDTSVVEAEIVDTTVVFTETGLGTSDITVTIEDEGGLTASVDFGFIVWNVNDAPELVEAVPDFELVNNIGSIAFGLDTLFRDKDMDTLIYSIVVSDTDLVGYIMSDSVLTFNALDVGVVEVILTASDTALSAVDTFNITVVEEVLLLLRYEGRRMQNKDTVDVCNPAGAVFVEVISSVEWGFDLVGEPTWLVVGIDQDSSVSLAFSQNLLDGPRVAEILVYDEQGHAFTFYLKQSDCTINVEAYGARSGLRMYPNPVEQVLYIAPAEGLLNGDVRLELIDSNGKLLYLQEIEAGAGTVEVDMSGYSEGMYFVRIRSGAGTWMDKIIKL